MNFIFKLPYLLIVPFSDINVLEIHKYIENGKIRLRDLISVKYFCFNYLFNFLDIAIALSNNIFHYYQNVLLPFILNDYIMTRKQLLVVLLICG